MKKKDPLLRKLPTNIYGLDRLLYGGLDMQKPTSIIVIKGNETSERTLLGLQMLYGLGQSIYRINKEKITKNCQETEAKSECPKPPLFVSTNISKQEINDMLLDCVISTGIQKLMTEYVSTPYPARDSITNIITRLFFNDIVAQPNRATVEIANNRIKNLIEERTDFMLGKEVLYYSDRTNCIHFRLSTSEVNDKDADSDEENMLFQRKHDIVNEYFRDIDIPPHVDAHERLLIEQEKRNRNEYNARYPEIPFINLDAEEYPQNNSFCSLDYMKSRELIALDIDETFDMYECPYQSKILKILQIIRRLQKIQVQREGIATRAFILIVPDRVYIPEHLVDMIIELSTITQKRFVYRYLSIVKSKRQTTVLGFHLYKRRDYGIEVYPSIQTYFEQRRYIQRALIYTHSGVLCDTYQQYINKKKNLSDESRRIDKVGYRNYMDTRKDIEKQYLRAIYPRYDRGMSPIDIIDRIFLSQTSLFPHIDADKSLERILDYQGCMTAVIGAPNTYKRFLTFGSIFSSSRNKEHSLILLMNKDDATIRRRLSCPARAEHDHGSEKCLHCYSYIHFMDICVGNITPDEFLCYLIKQLDTQYMDGKKIKRIVIDDLQIIDYCFPNLSAKRNGMFLSALASVCRDRGIWLYILCDTHCDMVNELSAVADNIVYTEKDPNGHLLMRIERYIGYTNSPSKVYSCKVKKASEFFECYEKIDDDDNVVPFFELNSQQVINKL